MLDMTRLSSMLIDETPAAAPDTFVGRVLVRDGARAAGVRPRRRGARLVCRTYRRRRAARPQPAARTARRSRARSRGSRSASAPSARATPTAATASASSSRSPAPPAYLPGDGTEVPDYLVASDAEAPEVRAVRAIACDGSFAQQFRFDVKPPGAARPAAASWRRPPSSSPATRSGSSWWRRPRASSAHRCDSRRRLRRGRVLRVPRGARPADVHRRARVRAHADAGRRRGAAQRADRCRPHHVRPLDARRRARGALPRGGVSVPPVQEGTDRAEGHGADAVRGRRPARAAAPAARRPRRSSASARASSRAAPAGSRRSTSERRCA